MSHQVDSPHGFRSLVCCNCGDVISIPIHCSSKECEPCLNIRRYRIRNKIDFAMSKFTETQGYSWKHITLTIRSSYDLDSMLNHLVKSFRNLRHRKFWKATDQTGFYVIEITKGKSGWHPHFHLISYGLYIPWQKLLYHWSKVTGDSRGAFIRYIPQGTHISRYVTKYITKVNGLSKSEYITVDKATKHRRLFGTFGLMHKLIKNFKSDAKRFACEKCGSTDWLPEFLLEVMQRSAVKDRRATLAEKLAKLELK